MDRKKYKIAGLVAVGTITFAAGCFNLEFLNGYREGILPVLVQILTTGCWIATAGTIILSSSKPVNAASYLTFALICGVALSMYSSLTIFFISPFLPLGYVLMRISNYRFGLMEVIFATYILIIVEIWIIAWIKKKNRA